MTTAAPPEKMMDVPSNEALSNWLVGQAESIEASAGGKRFTADMLREAARRLAPRVGDEGMKFRATVKYDDRTEIVEGTYPAPPAASAEREEDVEAISRRAFPESWAKIDANIADDDWNGGAALNLRDMVMKETRAVLKARIA